MKDIYSNAWASLVVWLRNLKDDEFSFIDWESHGNIKELPNGDLIGPLAISVMEYDEGLHQINFSIGVSTYVNDDSLFRLRGMVNKVYNAMMSGEQIVFYEQESAHERSIMQMRPGSHVAPMTDLTNRPFQYVQGSALLLPDGQSS